MNPPVRDLNEDWWLSHLQKMADHYGRLYERHEVRARYVLAALAFGLTVAHFAIDLSSLRLDIVARTILSLFLFSLFVVGLMLLSVMTPLRGARYFNGSLADLLHRIALSTKATSLVKSLFGWTDFSDLSPYLLSARYRKVADAFGLRSPEARRVLSDYLQGEFRTDLWWWVAQDDGTETGAHIFDIRRRQIFWYWANKEASNRKAIVLEWAMSVLTRFSALLLAVMVGYKLWMGATGI